MYQEAIDHEVLNWEHIQSASHRFGGIEFNLQLNEQTIEIGHVHHGSMLDILFSSKIRDILLAEGKTDPHHLYPETGWVSYYLRSEADVAGASWLLRLSYLQMLFKATRGSQLEILAAELGKLDVSAELRQAAFPRLANKR